MRITLSYLCGIAALLLSVSAVAQTPRPGILIVEALKKGGHVIFFRHMHADVGEDQLADSTYWKDCAKQRMLSQRGRLTAHRVGLMLRGLGIPVSKTLSGELCRAKQSADLLGLGNVETSPGLNDYNTWKAQGNDTEKLVEAYRALLGAMPPPAGNIILVSHVQRGRFAAHPVLDLIEMGTAAIFRPKSDGTFELVATIRPSDWELLGFTEIPS